MKTTNIDKFGKIHKGKDIYTGDCIFPFLYNKKLQNSCVSGKTGDWCATQTDSNNKTKKWAYCSSGSVAKKSVSIKKPTTAVKKPTTLVKKTITKKKPTTTVKKVSPVKSVGVRYFEVVEGSSFKFWSISKDKSGVIINYGRIGAEPRTSKFAMDDEESDRYIKKKIAEKIRKGYKEVSKMSNRTNASMKPSPKKYEKSSKKKSPISNSVKILKTKKCDNSVGTPVWDVKRNGVMLAHTYKDPKTGAIKNPPKGFPKAPIGWYMSEKYDGYRAIWDGEKFVSRNGNIFETPKWFKAFLPPGVALDGELFMGRECFQQCGIFRRKVPDDSEWRKLDIKYQIFDSPTHPGVFEERIAFIKSLIAERCKCDKKKLGIPSEIKCPLIFTEQKLVKHESELIKYFNTVTKGGGEGVMIRAPKSPYESKRSSLLLKVKQMFDDECKIIGYKMGTGKYKGMLGSFHCQMVKNPKIQFDISGMNDEIRGNYRKTHPIGTTITFTYMGLSDSGVPRHPNYLRIRNGKF